MALRIISDIHGQRDKYLEIIKDCENSLQLGDFGFHYDFLDNIGDNHLVFAGNHDNHDDKYNYSNFLQKWGFLGHGDVDFFFLEGGFSIDQQYRRELEEKKIWPKTWWENEELPDYELGEALRIYKGICPDVLITHEPSRLIANKLGNSDLLRNWGYDPETFTTRTGEIIQKMIEAHAPKLHIFGHFHVNFDEVINGTRYICQEELGYLDLFPDLSVKKYSYKTSVEVV